MRLAGAAVAEGDDVLAADDVFATRQFQYQRLVERGQCQEVEAVEAFHRWELRFLDPPLDHAPLPLDQFQFGETQQIRCMVHTLGRALTGEFVIFAQEARQLQRLQMMREQDLRRIGHDTAPVSRAM